MGLCDPKAVRSGKAWYQVVNEPGYMQGHLPGTLQSPPLVRDNKSSQNERKEQRDEPRTT